MARVQGLVVLGFAIVLAGCDLGIDEAQIAGGAGGAPATSVTMTTTGPGSSTSASGSSVSTGSGDGGGPATTATTTTTSTTTTVASTSTGALLPQVNCIDGMFNLVMCQPGQVCCIFPGGGFGECADQCGGMQATFECDGPEDCDAGDECCAPNEENGDVTCTPSCSDDDTVCKDDGDCSDSCSEEFSGPLGQAYVTCF